MTRKRMFNIMKKTSLRGKKKGWDDGTERKRLYHTDGHAADHIGFIFFTVCPLQKSEESMDPRDPFFSAACGTDRSCGMCAVTGRRFMDFRMLGALLCGIYAIICLVPILIARFVYRRKYSRRMVR